LHANNLKKTVYSAYLELHPGPVNNRFWISSLCDVNEPQRRGVRYCVEANICTQKSNLTC